MDINFSNPLDEEYKLESFRRLLEIDEAEFMASANYHQNPTAALCRKEATAVILQIYSAGTQHNNPKIPKEFLIPLVALTYFDRFFSRQPLQKNQSLEGVKLIALGCLSLAWKMRTIKFNLRQLLDSLNLDKGLVVEVTRIELWILSTLKWRMRCITALSFLDFFISLLNMFRQSRHHLKTSAANHFVKQMYTIIRFTQFKPSIMAASALVAEARFSGPFIDLKVAFEPYVNMDELNRCIDQIATKDVLMAIMNTVRQSKQDRIGESRDEEEAQN